MLDYDRPRALAVQALQQVTETGAFANEVLNRLFDQSDLKELDRNFTSALVYGVLDYLPYLDHVISCHSHYGLDRIDSCILNILRLGVWQIEFSDQIPNSAAVNEAVKLTGYFGRARLSSFVNAVLRNAIRHPVQLKNKQVNLKYGMTPELYGLYRKWFGEKEGQAILTSYLKKRDSYSLLFLGKAEDEARWLERVLDKGFKLEPGYLLEGAYRISGLTRLEDLPGFREGLIYIQDESSMLVAETLRISKARTLLDACAGQGGKTIAFLSRKTNLKITCLEPNLNRYQGFMENFNRLGLEKIQHPPEIHRLDLKSYAKKAKKNNLKFDQVLLDVPCSGLGVLSHKPEIKQGLSYNKLQEFPALQLSLLEEAGDLVSEKGYLVYSTCTLNPDENQGVIKTFLAGQQGREFSTVDVNPLIDRIKSPYKLSVQEGINQYGLTLRPDKLPVDGFFIACLQKQGGRLEDA